MDLILIGASRERRNKDERQCCLNKSSVSYTSTRGEGVSFVFLATIKRSPLQYHIDNI